MPKTVEFIFDFASPNAYLAYKVLTPIVARTQSQLIVTPCLLGGIFKATGNQAPFTAFAGIKGKMDYEMLETRRFIAKHGLTKFSMNPNFPLNSITAIRGLIAAQAAGVEQAYLEAVLAGFWEQGLMMSHVGVIADALNVAGLDGAGLMEAAQGSKVKETLLHNTQNAVDRGAFGVPTFFVGQDMFFGKERLVQVEEALTA
jgi:2-hydroxychromene-2-carboxylate isomerase